MFFLNLLISILGPLGAGKLMERMRFRKVFRNLLALGSGASREEIAEASKAVVLAAPKEEETLAWGTLAAVVTANITLASGPLALASVLALTAGFGLNRMVRNKKPTLEKGSFEGAREAMRQLMEIGSANAVEGLAQGLYDSGNEELQGISVHAMTAWASSWSVGFLKEAQNSDFIGVAEKARRGNNVVARLLFENKDAQIGQLIALRDKGRYWNRLGTALQAGIETPLLLNGPEDIPTDADQLHHAFDFQAQLVAAFPRVYCLQCRTRGVKYGYNGWDYVHCRTCLEAGHMLAGVEKVSGQIGPVVKPVLQGGMLPVNLWDEGERAPRPAEVDRIDILPGAEFKYDWAVSAAVEAVRNRFPDRELKVEVNVHGGLELGQNTRNLLHTVSNGLGSGLY